MCLCAPTAKRLFHLLKNDAEAELLQDMGFMAEQEKPEQDTAEESDEVKKARQQVQEKEQDLIDQLKLGSCC